MLVNVIKTVSSHKSNAPYQNSSLPPTPPILPVFSVSAAHPLMGEVPGNLLSCFSQLLVLVLMLPKLMASNTFINWEFKHIQTGIIT